MNSEFAQYLKEVNLKAIDFKETQFARGAVNQTDRRKAFTEGG